MTDLRPALRIRGLAKSFAGVPALHPLDWDIRAGEIHALMGQNGSGKSTLVKSLTGYYTPDAGTVEVFGRALELPVRAAHRHRLAVIHQDLGLADSLTVLENLGANAGYGTRVMFGIHQRRERATYTALFERLDISLDLDSPVAELSPAEKALVAVARAMRVMQDQDGAQVFILDEPTASLSRLEAGRVISLMRRVAALGSSVVFISHRIGEVMSSCDRITVLRDGRKINTSAVTDLTKADLVELMLGRRMQDYYPDRSTLPADAPTRLVVENVRSPGLGPISFSVNEGEIVGLTGLAGMGQDQIPYLLSGAARPDTGTVIVNGTSVPAGDNREAIGAGIVLVPGNRHRDGCWLDGTAGENITLPTLRSYRTWRGLRLRVERASAADLVASAGVVPPDPMKLMRRLSGGNQQKVVFAKWLTRQPQVLLLDEPTQGVDAGAARQLLDAVAETAERGAAVVVASGDHEQLSALCHRVLVLHEGEVVAELAGDQLTERALLQLSEHHTDAIQQGV